MAHVIGDVHVSLPVKKDNLQTINKGKSINLTVDSSIKKVELPKLNRKTSTCYIDTINYEASSLKIYDKISKLERSNGENFIGVVCEKGLLLDIRDMKMTYMEWL